MSSIAREVQVAGAGMQRAALKRLFDTTRADMSTARGKQTTTSLNSGGLVIKAGGSALAKTAVAVYGFVDCVLFTKAAADMAALAGTVTNAAFNVFVFTSTVAGTLATTMGTEGASLAAITFPAIPTDAVVVGFVIINPTGTGGFVGGTTALDDGTVVPNAVYVNTGFPFDPVTTLTLGA